MLNLAGVAKPSTCARRDRSLQRTEGRLEEIKKESLFKEVILYYLETAFEVTYRKYV